MSMNPGASADRMGTMPVGKLLVSMAVPMMMSMLVQALYNIVDSIFVAQLSEDALTAVSLAFPVQNILIAIAVGIAVGVNALISRYLGMGEREKANHVAMQGYFLAFCSTAIFMILGLTLVDPFAASQVDMSQPNAAMICEGTATYLRIISLCSVGVFVVCLEERLFSSTGKSLFTMGLQMTGAIINIILDPIMIFGLFGCPAMGVAGAAYATVIGQITSAVLGYVLCITKNKDLHLDWKQVKPDWPVLKSILGIGVPSMMMSAIGSLLTYILNIILIGFSSTAVAVYGAYFKLNSFIFMPIFGLNNGLVPIVAYNYGAGKVERIHQTVKLAMASAATIMLCGLALFNLIPETLLGMFNASEEMLRIGVPALKTISLSFAFAGICIVSGSVCQALGFATYSLYTSVARQLVVLLPCIYLLSLTGEVTNIWYAWPIAEIASLTASMLLLRKAFKKTGLLAK